VGRQRLVDARCTHIRYPIRSETKYFPRDQKL